MGYRPGQEPEKPWETWERSWRAARRKMFRGMLAMLLSGTLIIYGSVKLIQYTSDLSASRETSRELQRIQAGEEPWGQAQPEETQVPPADQAAAETGIPQESRETEATEAEAGERTQETETEAVKRTPEAETTAAAPETDAEKRREDPLPAPQTAAAAENPDLLPALPYTDKPYLLVSERFLRLRKRGEYIIGWLSMDQVEEAVVQKDNSFFLDHDATGRRNINGAIFLDRSVNLRTRPYTLILYGHNMKSGNMFGHLKKYRDSSYFYSHRMITFDSMYEDGKYAVFAVMEMNTVPGTAAWYNLWSLETERRADREEAIRKLERKSLIGCSLDVRADDQILLLVTCLDGEDERLVVAARRLREGESESSLTIRQ